MLTIGEIIENENINDEVNENDSTENSSTDYTDILEHISDSLDSVLLSSSSETLEDSSSPVHTIDDLYDLGSCVLVVLVVMLVLKAFHNIVSNVKRM